MVYHTSPDSPQVPLRAELQGFRRYSALNAGTNVKTLFVGTRRVLQIERDVSNVEKRSCSFCCKSQDEVSALIVDRDGWAGICNECIHLATEIIGKQRTVATAVPPADDGLDLPPSLRRAAP